MRLWCRFVYFSPVFSLSMQKPHEKRNSNDIFNEERHFNSIYLCEISWNILLKWIRFVSSNLFSVDFAFTSFHFDRLPFFPLFLRCDRFYSQICIADGRRRGVQNLWSNKLNFDFPFWLNLHTEAAYHSDSHNAHKLWHFKISQTMWTEKNLFHLNLSQFRYCVWFQTCAKQTTLLKTYNKIAFDVQTKNSTLLFHLFLVVDLQKKMQVLWFHFSKRCKRKMSFVWSQARLDQLKWLISKSDCYAKCTINSLMRVVFVFLFHSVVNLNW